MKNQLTYQNNWEYDQYFVKGKQLSSLKLVSIDDVDYKVTSNPVSISYNDMGHTYSSTSDHYFITVDIVGIPTQVDLNTLVDKKQIIAKQFTEIK